MYAESDEVFVAASIYRELKAVLPVSGYNGETGKITWSGVPNQAVADLIIAAHDKAFSSTEVLALKAALGVASPEWAAYMACRKQPIINTRIKEFGKQVDNLFFDLFFDASAITDNGDGTVSLKFNKAKLQELAAIRAKIKTDNPFPA